MNEVNHQPDPGSAPPSLHTIDPIVVAKRRESILSLAGNALDQRVRHRKQVQAASSCAALFVIMAAALVVYRGTGSGGSVERAREQAAANETHRPSISSERTVDSAPEPVSLASSTVEPPILVKLAGPLDASSLPIAYASSDPGLLDRFTARLAPPIQIQYLSDTELLESLAVAGVKHDGLARIGHDVRLIGWHGQASEDPPEPILRLNSRL